MTVFKEVSVLNELTANGGQHAVPGKFPHSVIPSVQVDLASDASTFGPAVFPPKIPDYQLPSNFVEAIENFRSLSYGEILVLFEKVEISILQKSLDVDFIKVLATELCTPLVNHLKESFTAISISNLKSLPSDPILLSAIFDSIRSVMESISSVTLEEYDRYVQALVSWISTMVCSKIILVALRLDRYAASTPIPSRSDIHDGLIKAIYVICTKHSFKNNEPLNTTGRVTNLPSQSVEVVTQNLNQHFDDDLKRRKYAEDRVSKLEIIDRVAWSGQDDQLKRNFFEFKLRLLDNVELYQLSNEYDCYFLYILKNLSGVPKDLVSEGLRVLTYTDPCDKVEAIWQILTDEYDNEFYKRIVTKEWRSVSQRRDESLSAFINRFGQLQRIYSEAVKINLSERELITALQEALFDNNLKADLIRNLNISKMKYSEFRSEVLRRSQSLEDISHLTKKSTFGNVIDLNSANTSHQRPQYNNNHRHGGKGKGTSRYRSKSPFSHNQNNSNRKYQNSQKPYSPECKRCGCKGHSSVDCPADFPINSSTRCQCCGSVLHTTLQCDITKSSVTCNRCNTVGHMATICGKKVSEIRSAPKVRFDHRRDSVLEISNHSIELANASSDSKTLPTKTINLFCGYDCVTSALLDSGADLSMIHPEFLSHLIENYPEAKVSPLPGTVTVRVADDRKISKCAQVLVRLSFAQSSDPVDIPMVIFPSLSRACIISFDELRKFGICWLATPAGDRIFKLPADFDVNNAEVRSNPVVAVKPDVKPLKSCLKRSASCPPVAAKVADNGSSTDTVSRSVTPDPDDSESDVETIFDLNRIELIQDSTDPFDLFSISELEESPSSPKLDVQRFRFRIPWKSEKRPSNNRSFALKMSRKLESDLKSKGLYHQYDAEMKNLLTIGAVREVPDHYGKFYIPHFGVPVKSSSSFSGVRPVFNAKPLNVFLRKCKILHHSVLGNILAFRKFENVRLWDYSKSFYQLEFTDDERHEVDELIHPNSEIGREFSFCSDSDPQDEYNPSPYLTFIWNEREYSFTRVIMGGISSPSHLQRAVEILKTDSVQCLDNLKVPHDTYVLNTFMDDGVAGAVDSPTLNLVFDAVGQQMKIRSLPDNPAKRFGLVDKVIEVGSTTQPIDHENIITKSVTGLQWNITKDTLTSDTLKFLSLNHSKSYADFRSLTASFYDPYGEYLEHGLIGRSILQKALNDEKDLNMVSEQTLKLMTKWKDDTLKLQSVTRTLDKSVSEVVFMFCDGSSKGIACTLESITEQRIMARGNLSDESRAPRFELNSLVLGCETIKEFLDYGVYKPKNIIFCTDSLVNLGRLKSSGKRKECGIYEFNRLIKIRDTLKSALNCGSKVYIKHIPGNINPSDSPSRLCEPDPTIRSTLQEWKRQCIDNISLDKDNSFQISVDDEWLPTLEEEKSNCQSPKAKKISLLNTEVTLNNASNIRLFQHNEDLADHFYAAKLLKRTLNQWTSAHTSTPLSGYTNLNSSPILYLVLRSQSHDRFCREIVSPSISRSHVSRVRLESTFKVVDGTVFKRFSDRWLVYIPDNEALLSRFVVRHFHLKCHGSAKFIEGAVRKIFSIRNLGRLVNSSKLQCHTCLTSSNHSPPSFSSSMSQSPVSQVPWSYVGVDHVGPLPLNNTFRVILVITCMITGYIVTFPCSTCDSTSSIRSLEKCFWEKGFPTKIRVDNGSAFRSRQFVEYCTLRGIRITYSPPFHPGSNGKLEISHKSLNNFLRTLSINKSCSWVDVLSESQLLANSKIISGGHSPFELLHTYSPRLPYFDDYSCSWQPKPSVHDQRAAAMTRYKEFLEIDAPNARNKTVTTINSKSLAKTHSIQVGDVVYKRIFNRSKLSPFYKGPFRVLAIAGGNIAIVDNKGLEQLTHVDNIKKAAYGSSSNTAIEGESYEAIKNRILAKRSNENILTQGIDDQFEDLSKICDTTGGNDQFNDLTKCVDPTGESATDNFTSVDNFKPEISKSKTTKIVSSFPLNVSVRWKDESNVEHSGQVVELKPGLAVIHRYQPGTDDVLSFINYGDRLHPDLAEVDYVHLRRLLPNRGK